MPPRSGDPFLQKPRSVREVPRYLGMLLGGFFHRLGYILALVWKTSPLIFIFQLLITIANGVLPVIGAYISAEILNRLVLTYSSNSTQTQGLSQAIAQLAATAILSLLILQFAYLFVKKMVSTLQTLLTRISGELVSNHIRMQIMTKAKDVDLASFDSPDFYEKLENANREAGHRPIQILNSTFQVISTVISMVGFLAILVSISPWIAALIFVISFPSALIGLVYRKKYFKYFRHHSKERRQMSYYSGLMVNKDMVKEIRIFSLSDFFIGRYREIFSRYFHGMKRLFRNEALWNLFLALCSVLANGALFAYIAWGVSLGRWQIGDYSLYTGALNSVSSGVATLIGAVTTVYEGTLFIDNLISFMKEEKTITSYLDTPVIPQKHVGHSIEFCDVSFCYPGTDKRVLDHVSLKIEAGESIALVGLNGAGKTTFLKLLMRLYDPTEGVILLDGVDLRHYDVSALYGLFGTIFQDFGKYAVTVSENIAFGDIQRPIDGSQVDQAAENGGAKGYILALPNQYDTPLMRYFEDNGLELSIGQWQKLSVSRAFYSDSDILILDEPTASLDPLAEQELFAKFDSLRQGKTTIFVSHRLFSATTANRVIVLEHGTVLEQGSHAALMRKNGRYYELFTAQAKHYFKKDDEEILEYGKE